MSRHSPPNVDKAETQNFLEALAQGKEREALAILERCKGVDVTATKDLGRSALWLATGCGAFNVVKKLLAADVDINQPDDSGHSPITISVITFNHEISRLLFQQPHLIVSPPDLQGTPALLAEPADYVLYAAAFLLQQSGILPILPPPQVIESVETSRFALLAGLLRHRYHSKRRTERGARRGWRSARRWKM